MTGRIDSSGGLTWARTYEDETGLVDTQKVTKTGTSKTFEWIDLGYDKAGNVTSRMEKLWRLGTTLPPSTTAGDTGTGTWTYGYDGAGRMLTASGPGPTGATKNYTYTYDGQGNRTQMVDGGTTWTWTTDNQGWPTEADKSTTGANPDVVYTFDPAGDLTGADDQVSDPNDLAFGYDSWGLTSSATAGATGVGYTLDPLGRTASRTVSGATTTYAYAGSGEDLATYTASGTTTKFAYGPGGPLASKVVGAGSATLFIPDLHGDVVATIASGASSLTDTAWYSPYGERTTLAGSATQLGYQGDYTDASTGTVDMTTRWYLPSLGRFTSRDVLGGDPHDPPSLNRFVYATGSPVTYSDPTGMHGRAQVDRANYADDRNDAKEELDPEVYSCVYERGCAPSNVDRVEGVLFLAASPLILSEEGLVLLSDWAFAASTWTGATCLTYSNLCARGLNWANGVTDVSAEAASTQGQVPQVLENDVAVYTSTNSAGKVEYVGITNNIERRAAEQLSQKGIEINPIEGLESLRRVDARAVEQVLIEENGGPKGGQLLNKINSIASSNPAYSQLIQRGCALLTRAGYGAPNVCG